MQFDRNKFLQDFECVLKGEYATDLTKADVKQLYNAVGRAVMANLKDDWTKSDSRHEKRCAYLSAEFLVGRAIFSNLLNLGVLEEVKNALFSCGIDINRFEEVEDAALGNGGLGRLAACYLESAATHDIPLDGYGLRYRYGLFKQSFQDGFQHEEGDDWLKWGDPWGIRRENETLRVDFADFSVLAVPYDTPVIGYKNAVINTLRLYSAEPEKSFDFKVFDEMRGKENAVNDFEAMKITDVLYPNDNTEEGKLLRLRQEYFLASAAVQDLLRRFKKTGKPLLEFGKTQQIQLNDTHPVIAIPELIRLLIREGLSFENAFEIASRTFNFTNHTIMGEALEKWQSKTLKTYLPEIYSIIKSIHRKLKVETGNSRKYFIEKSGIVHMANLAIYVSCHVNGVAEIHTGILKEKTFRDWFVLFPDKFINVTNGITPRRWFLLNNPKMAKEISDRIGTAWETDLSKISAIEKYINDPIFRGAFYQIKQENKRILAEYILEHEGVEIPEHFIFDVQIKRLHEYKRQLLNAFSVLAIYNGIKSGSITGFKPTAFIFGAKSAPGYYVAKAIIKFINEIANKINNDEEVKDKLRVVFVQNYNVSYAEKLVCAADVSEQISMAGMEASGTGNMKFMLNGTVTLGTLDGANVEICEEAGRKNNYIFGANKDEVDRIKKDYIPQKELEKNPQLKQVVESLVDGTFSDGGTGVLKAVYDSLLKGERADYYLVLHDFSDYMRAKLELNRDYGTEEFITKSLKNMANAGKFTSDRSVREYAKEIWEI